MSSEQLQFPNKLVAMKSEREEVDLTNASIFSFQMALIMAAILTISGLLHLAKLVWDGGQWNGPLSLRKSGLFGVSSGLTVWSIARLMPHSSVR